MFDSIRCLVVVVFIGCSDPHPGGPDAARSVDASLADGSPACSSYQPPAGHEQLNPRGIQLVDVTDAIGVRYRAGRLVGDAYGIGAGVGVGDVDGDGDPDVVLARNGDPASPDPSGPPTLLLTVPTADGWGFEESPAFAGSLSSVSGVGVALGDADGDGDLDVFIAAQGRDALLRNRGDGTFDDVTDEAGVGGPDGDWSTSAVWSDVNGDGALDLYVASFVLADSPYDDPRVRNRLYLNRGESFEDVSDQADVAGRGGSHAVLVADLDGDWESELYVANDTFAVDGEFGTAALDPDVVYDPIHVDPRGVPVFFDRAAQWGVDHPNSSMGIALGDIDMDGDDDLYVADFGRNRAQLWDSALERYFPDGFRYGLRASTPPGVSGPVLVAWGVEFVDLDRDGALEVFVVNGDIGVQPPDAGWCQHDLYFRASAPGLPFADSTTAVGLSDVLSPCSQDEARNGRGFARADFDGDGDDDVVVAPYAEAYRFYRNDTPTCGRTFVRARLRGTVSAPDPVGAVVSVEDDRGILRRRQLYGGGQPCSQGDRVLELGLDGARSVSRATVRWPSGLVQRVEDSLVVNGEVDIVEPRWLTLSRTEAGVGDPAPVLEYVALDAFGEPLGRAGAGRHVVVSRSDGGSAPVTDHGDGRYTAVLVHPAEIRYTVVRIAVDGVVLAPRLIVDYHP